MMPGFFADDAPKKKRFDKGTFIERSDYLCYCDVCGGAIRLGQPLFWFSVAGDTKKKRRHPQCAAEDYKKR